MVGTTVRPRTTAGGLVDDHRRRGILFLLGRVGCPATPEPRPGVQGQAALRLLFFRPAPQHGEVMGRRHDAVTGRATDAGAQLDGFRVRANVGKERRGDQVRDCVAVDVGRATRAADAASGARGGRNAYDMYDLRGQGYRFALRHHHVRGVSAFSCFFYYLLSNRAELRLFLSTIFRKYQRP